MESRNTIQKKMILDTLSSVRTHPTAYELYDLLRKKDSSIGQATVYRNIKKFAENGIIHIIKTKSGVDRYDYYGEHAHFECISCGKIADIFDEDLFKELKNKNWQKKFDIIDYNIVVSGYCNECKRSSNEEV